MPSPKRVPETESLFTRCLALSRQAEAAGSYEAAYHALMATLHLADLNHSLDQLNQVTELAHEQEQRLEALDPPHALSKAASTQRGTTAVYQSFQVHAEAVSARLKAHAARDHVGHHLGLEGQNESEEGREP